jgi:hypothetical protein
VIVDNKDVDLLDELLLQQRSNRRGDVIDFVTSGDDNGERAVECGRRRDGRLQAPDSPEAAAQKQ